MPMAALDTAVDRAAMAALPGIIAATQPALSSGDFTKWAPTWAKLAYCVGEAFAREQQERRQPAQSVEGQEFPTEA